MDDKVIQEVVKNISENHSKIIEDWCQAYLAQLYEEGVKIKPGCFVLNELVPTVHNGQLVKKYWFTLKQLDENGVPF